MKQLGFQNVRMETDVKYVAMSLSRKKQDRYEYGSIIREHSSILSNEDGYSVHFVRRQANEIAHVLAKLSSSLASPMVWYEPPYDVIPRLHDICYERY